MSGCTVCEQTASAGYQACGACVERVRRQIREIELYESMLRLMVRPVVTDRVRRSPGYGSSSPANDDVITALDPRSQADDCGHGSISASVYVLAEWVRTARGDVGQSPRLVRDIGYLLGALDWCARYGYLRGVADFVRTVHSACRYLAHDAPARALGTCLPKYCGVGAVYPYDGDRGRCAQCGHVYGGLDLIEFGEQ